MTTAPAILMRMIGTGPKKSLAKTVGQSVTMRRDVVDPHDTGCRVDTGWLGGLHVPLGFAAVRDLIPAGASVLVTSLDSGRELTDAARLLELLRAAGFTPTFLGGGLVFKEAEVAQLVENESFFAGFDELWVFPAAPVALKPPSVVLTSARPVVVSEDLESWMCGAGCLVGLGDGDGLNFATTEPEIAARLRAAAN